MIKSDGVQIVETPEGVAMLVMMGDRALPILIGPAEAFSIARGLGEAEFPRPLTHDLFIDVLEALGATVEKVTIDALISSTYTATLYVRDRDGKIHAFDSRPSDAVAIAVRTNAPIYVAETLKKYAVSID